MHNHFTRDSPNACGRFSKPQELCHGLVAIAVAVLPQVHRQVLFPTRLPERFGINKKVLS
jgi:hypothetical protein